MMQNLDGWDFLLRMKQIPDLNRVPVVIISILALRTRGFALCATAIMHNTIIRVTSMDIGPADQSGLNGHVAKIMGKTSIDTERFLLEIRRATSVRLVVV